MPAPRLARTTAWVVVASMAGFVATRALQGVELEVTREHLDPQLAVRLVDHLTGNPLLAPLLALFLGGTVVGVALLAVTTWRGGFPRPAVALLAAFPVIELANFTGGPLGAVLSHLVLLAALTWMARTLWAASRRG